MASLSDIVPSGVITGDDLLTLLEHARANSYAIPAVNCTRYVRWDLRTFFLVLSVLGLLELLPPTSGINNKKRMMTSTK
jgi:hypothetical protein